MHLGLARACEAGAPTEAASHEKPWTSTASASHQPAATSSDGVGAAGAPGEILFQQDPPGNRGSAFHLQGTCKPCNKFNPDRPDSCKHADDCDFCHYPHERPKHRGQRGRHAQQRRQYLEIRDSLPEEVQNLTDKVYEVPHEAFEEVKRRLQTVPREYRHHKVLDVLDKVRHIGEQAQECRPDKHRVRGARIVTPEGAGPVSELEGRCKWLIGTLHLMVRKMYDAQKEIGVIKDKVNEVLEQCRQLPDLVTAVEPPLPALPPGCADKLQLSKAFEWLSRTIVLLAASAAELVASATMQQGPTSEDIACDLEKISTMSKGILAEADLNPEAKDQLQSSQTLIELRSRMKELEDRVSWDGAKSSKEDREKTMESRLGDLEHLLSELHSDEGQYKEILAKVAPAKLDERWSPLEKKIELCAIEELKRNASRLSVHECVRSAYQSAALLPDAVEKIGLKLDKTPNLPAFISDRNELRKNMIKELDSSQDMKELLAKMRSHIDS